MKFKKNKANHAKQEKTLSRNPLFKNSAKKKKTKKSINNLNVLINPVTTDRSNKSPSNDNISTQISTRDKSDSSSIAKHRKKSKHKKKSEKLKDSMKFTAQLEHTTSELSSKDLNISKASEASEMIAKGANTKIPSPSFVKQVLVGEQGDSSHGAKRKGAKKRNKPFDAQTNTTVSEVDTDLKGNAKRIRIDSSLSRATSTATKVRTSLSRSQRKRLRRKQKRAANTSSVTPGEARLPEQAGHLDSIKKESHPDSKSLIQSAPLTMEFNTPFEKKLSKRQRKKNKTHSKDEQEEKLQGNKLAFKKKNISFAPVGKSVVASSQIKSKNTTAQNSLGRKRDSSSDSEPELIHADWQLSDMSSLDLDESVEDVDESDKELDDASLSDEEDVDQSDEDDDDVGDDDDDSLGDSNEIDEAPTKKSSKAVVDKSQKVAVSSSEQKIKKVVEVDDIPSEKLTNAVVAKNKFMSFSDKLGILEEVKSRSKDLSSRSIYLSPIPPNCSFDMLKKFSPHMACCRLPINPKSRKLRRYAFLEYKDAATATKEQLNLSGRLFCDATVRAEIQNSSRSDSVHSEGDFSQATVDSLEFSRLIVFGLVPAVTAVDLRTIFPSASSVSLATSGNGTMLGFATLTFLSPQVAFDAFTQNHGFVLRGHPITVNFPFKREPASSRASEKLPTSALIRPHQKLPQLKHSVSSEDDEHDKIESSKVLSNSGKSKVLVQTIANSDDENDDSTALATDLLNVVQQRKVDAIKPANNFIATVQSNNVASIHASKSGNLISNLFKQKASEQSALGGKMDLDSHRVPDDDEEISVEGGEDDDDYLNENEEDDSDEDDLDEGEEDDDEEDEESDVVEVDESEEGDIFEDDESEGDNVDEDDAKEGGTGVEKEDEEEGIFSLASDKIGISSEEEIDSLLNNALNARKACAKSLKAPGAKHNWKISNRGKKTSKASGKKRPGTIPTILSIPKVRGR